MKKYYARQKDDMVYEKLLNADGVADTLKTEPYKPWFVRDYGDSVAVSQDGVVLVMSKTDFDKKFAFSNNTDFCGVFECFHCGSRSVIWDCDYDFADFGYDGEGIV